MESCLQDDSRTREQKPFFWHTGLVHTIHLQQSAHSALHRRQEAEVVPTSTPSNKTTDQANFSWHFDFLKLCRSTQYKFVNKPYQIFEPEPQSFRHCGSRGPPTKGPHYPASNKSCNKSVPLIYVQDNVTQFCNRTMLYLLHASVEIRRSGEGIVWLPKLLDCGNIRHLLQLIFILTTGGARNAAECII